MYSAILFTFVAASVIIGYYDVDASTISINNTYYSTERGGSFLLIERHEDSIVINEYPAFYTEDNLEIGDEIRNDQNYTVGYVIGQHENYYPITPFRAKMWCGDFDIKELASHRSVSFRDHWWNNVSLSRLKETVAPSDCDRTPDTRLSDEYYPFATVLRLRVLQIVCGISFLIVGTVAFIEERGELNLSLGIPAGGTTILAAATSIHTTKGFGGYRASTCLPGSPFRFLGPSVRIAVPVAILWGSACSFLAALVVQCIRTLAGVHQYELYEDFIPENATDITVLASVELVICVITLLSVLLLLRIDCKFDPD